MNVFEPLALLLALEEKLRGHPHLAATKALVDQELIKINEVHKAEAEKALAEKKIKAAYDARAAEKAALADEAKQPSLNIPPPPPAPARADGMPSPTFMPPKG